MRGSATITTTTTVTPVHTTQVRNAEVVQASANSIIVRGAKGFQMYTEGDVEKRGIKVYKNGRPVTFSDLHAGDELTATIVTEGPPKVVTQREVQARLASPPPPPAAQPRRRRRRPLQPRRRRRAACRGHRETAGEWNLVADRWGPCGRGSFALVVIMAAVPTACLVVGHSTETRSTLSAPMRPARTVPAAIVLFFWCVPADAQDNLADANAPAARFGDSAQAPLLSLEKLTVTLQVPGASARTYFCRCAWSRRDRLRAPARGNADPVIAVDQAGRVTAILGKGMFKIPHSIKALIQTATSGRPTQATGWSRSSHLPGRSCMRSRYATHLWGKTVAFLPPPSTISSMRAGRPTSSFCPAAGCS